MLGSSECPRYAKAELLGDRLERSLPNFRVHKVVKQPGEWEAFLKELNKSRG